MSTHPKMLIAAADAGRCTKLRRLPVWQENGFETPAYAAGKAETIKRSRSDADIVVLCHEPPLISAPLIMKEMSGYDNSPLFIVISGSENYETMRECFLLGAVDFLIEPLNEQKLTDALARAKEHLKKNTSSYEYSISVDEYFNGLTVPDSSDKFIAELKSFISECENTTATTEYAADHFGFNKDYFGRMFKAKIGMSFGEFYNRFRMMYAERLLSSGRYKVYEVSELLGFASVDYFSSVFKKLTGNRPSDLKKY